MFIMPVKSGQLASIDYELAKVLVDSLELGCSEVVGYEERVRFCKYLYEVGLKERPRKSFTVKKIKGSNELRVTRIE